MTGPKEKKERALGTTLQLKAERSLSPKSALARRPFVPGQHGPTKRRKAPSDFGRQVQEKQKVKLSYGIDERNLRFIFKKAAKATGDISKYLTELLERRLDNVVFRAGLAASRGVARKRIIDGHIVVNGKRVRSPGYQVKLGDVVAIYQGSRERVMFKELAKNLEAHEGPYWLTLTPSKLEATVASLPKDVESPFHMPLIVESFSK